MTKEEYHSKIKELEQEVDIKKKLLRREFALSNNTVKIGDILEDHCHRIIVEKIGVYVGF